MWRGTVQLAVFIGLSVVLGGATFTACTQDDGDPGMCIEPASTPMRANEWVGFHADVPLQPADFHALASGLFGSDAQAGQFVKDRELAPGIFVSGDAETSTPDQSRVVFAFDDGENPRRTLAVVPASFSLGGIFISTVEAALAKMQDDNAADPGSGEAFHLEYRVTSAQGGTMSFGVRGDAGTYSLVVDVTSPHTSLENGEIGQASGDAAPFDTVAGTVWFHLTRDDFAFFSDHAYGQGATSKQNFNDFKLVPHTWLRLTVEPHLEQQTVQVGFEVVTPEGKRIPVAKAPASILAGDTFQAMVNRYVTTMLDQEKAMPGSSRPWKVPFYYDNPDGGGVVQVIAQGLAGQFSIAYAIESPRHPLKDVPFVPYQPVTITPPDPNETASCEMLGDPSIVLAPQGTLNITFTASDTILNSPDLMGPLRGTIYCDVFHREDVDITGPLPNAVAVQSIEVPDADLQAMPAPTFVTGDLLAGEYQVLCAQDIDNSGDASHGDPVTLPIGGYTVACNKNPVTVEFAILNPQ